MPVHSRYLDIAAKIRKRIEAGEWEPGAKLPRLDDFATQYEANRDTIGRAIAALETEGFVWAVQGRGIIVRHGMMRLRRPRGNLVKRNVAAENNPGYSFPSASGQEVWKHHIPPTAGHEPLNDPRIAKLLGVPVGTSIMRRFRVTGPESEPPFQINISWIHPRGEGTPEIASQHPGPGDWLYRLEMAGHWPISWMEIHRARMPTKDEADLLEIPTSLPVLEIVRVGNSGGDGKPIEVTEYIVASDRVETVNVLHRDESAQDPWPGYLAGPDDLRTDEGDQHS